MLSLQEISDRLEIQDLLVAYSHALDFRRWDELDDVFTADAHIDFSAFDSPTTELAAMKEHLRTTMALFSTYYHMVATSKVELHGDTATGATICHNPGILALPGDDEHLAVVGCWYHDTFVRTPAGWRIKERRIERCYEHDMPDLAALRLARQSSPP